MKFVADEGIDALVVAHLRETGYIVWYIAEMAAGISDSEVLELANQESAILLTADKDFGDLVYRQKRVSSGVILVRLHGLASEQKAELAVTTIQKYVEQLPHSFTVMTPQKVRIRPQMH
jgi:predicted nuclease of predicted toxin-antitoxin system